MTKNEVNSKVLVKLGVNEKIVKLLCSRLNADFLIGLELLDTSNPNYEIIKTYCIGNTSNVDDDTNVYWEEKGRIIYHSLYYRMTIGLENIKL